MKKRGKSLMEFLMEQIWGIVGILLLLGGGIFLLVMFLQKGSGHRDDGEEMSLYVTNKDRELLDLISDLATLYRSTGR